MSVFNFIISQSLRKQTSMRWSLVVIYLLLILPSIVLMSIAQSMENTKKRKMIPLLRDSSLTKILYYAFYYSPTILLSCALAIASTGSTFAAYIPLIWLGIVILCIIGLIINYFLFTQNTNKKQK